MIKKQKKLALFFSFGISLKEWESRGLLYREKLIYEKHLKNNTFDKIFWFTYGSEDMEIARRLKDRKILNENIIICAPKKIFNNKISLIIYSLICPFLYWKILRDVYVIKTNQMSGSWTAVIAKIITNKKLVVRCGYVLSLHSSRQNKSMLKKLTIRMIEKISIFFSNTVVVASKSDKKYLIKAYSINGNKIDVVPNYVNTEMFKDLNIPRSNNMVFVGRLSEEKNIFNLISAISKTNGTLDIYGGGPQEKDLKEFSEKIRANINFKGMVRNDLLPNILNGYKYYILPSLYEGTPKTLLEAMACGCICIGTKVDGITDILNDNNGVIANGTSVDDITLAIQKSQNIKSDLVSNNAIKTITENYSLDFIFNKEIEILHSLLKIKIG